MWSNWETMALLEFLRTHNYDLPNSKKVGFYGLDVYSLWESLEELRSQLRPENKEGRDALRRVENCFQPFSSKEGNSYAQATQVLSYSCESEVLQLMRTITKNISNEEFDWENDFNAEQNARVVANAENYYRTMLRGDSESWNVRDRHMMETLSRLLEYNGSTSKIIVWEHNSHIGDARASDMESHGMINIGQLAKQRYVKEGVIRIGFGTNSGTVLAGSSWGSKMKVMNLPNAKEESWENLLHQASPRNKIVISSKLKQHKLFRHPIDQRAVGVVYRPEQEHWGNYVPSLIPQRYEAFVYIDETTALHPFHVDADLNQFPETYPFGL
jgi:erythromycin esterase